jgi:site-specific recombinase XerD
MLTEAKAFVNWLRRTNPQAHTWKDYASDLKLFHQVVGDRPLSEIGVQDVDEFIIHQVERGFKAKTINRRLTTLKALYAFYEYEDPQLVCPVYPSRHQLREPRRLPRPVPIDDLRKFFAALDNPRDRAIFVLMLRCGLRIGEIAALRLPDLYISTTLNTGLQAETPRLLVTGKGSKQRPAYLSSQALRVLREYLRVRPESADDHLFLTYQHKGMSTHAIQMRLQRYRKKAGVHFTCHQLRHTFASDLNEADVPLTSIQKLLGHEWVETTMIYVQANDRKVQRDFLAASQKLAGWAA